MRKQLESYFDRLWPLPRSLTGEGVRQTHDILSEILPLKTIEIPSGATVFDWKVPQEWKVNEAYIITPKGKRILDFNENNLHLVGYSRPFRGTLDLDTLQAHLHSRSDVPNAIPYITSYYRDYWGFCLSHRQKSQLSPGDYNVVVDTELFNGSLTISEAILPGRTTAEILLTTYTCHPSMANDQLSGPLALAFLYKEIEKIKHREYTYRFLFLPETIGSITYLAIKGDEMKKNIIGGFVCALLAGQKPFTYRRSRRSNSLSDRIAEFVLTEQSEPFEITKFDPSRGNDQRQFCSPGFNLPIGSLTCTSQEKEAYYHTSLDNKENFSFENLEESIFIYKKIIEIFEKNKTFKSLKPFGEPFLSKYGMYSDIGTSSSRSPKDQLRNALMWFLNYADGQHDLLSISQESSLPFETLVEAAQQCRMNNLVCQVNESSDTFLRDSDSD